jgi:hypothetical protein
MKSTKPAPPVISLGSALNNKTHDADPMAILAGIKSGKWRTPVERIRMEYAKAVAEGRDPKKAVEHMKKALPAVIWSGAFWKREKGCLKQHSGLLCGDADHLDGQLEEVRAKVSTSPYVLAAFTSPTGTGLKILFRIPANPAKHLASFHAAAAHFHALTGAELDPSRKDINGLCFLSYDPATEINLAAQELQPMEEQAPALPPAPLPAEPTPSAPITTTADPRHKIVEDVLGTVQWTTPTKGTCTCPGKHRHTTGDGEKDCEIMLDGEPWLHCFHDSCKHICRAVSNELRSRLSD